MRGKSNLNERISQSKFSLFDLPVTETLIYQGKNQGIAAFRIFNL